MTLSLERLKSAFYPQGEISVRVLSFSTRAYAGMCVHFSHGSIVSTDGWDFQIMRVVALCEKCVFTSFVYQMKSQGKVTNFKLDLEDLFGLVGNQ